MAEKNLHNLQSNTLFRIKPLAINSVGNRTNNLVDIIEMKKYSLIIKTVLAKFSVYSILNINVPTFHYNKRNNRVKCFQTQQLC